MSTIRTAKNLAEEGKNEEAEFFLNRIIEGSFSSRKKNTARYVLARHYVEKGDMKEANRILQEIPLSSVREVERGKLFLFAAATGRSVPIKELIDMRDSALGAVPLTIKHAAIIDNVSYALFLTAKVRKARQSDPNFVGRIISHQLCYMPVAISIYSMNGAPSFFVVEAVRRQREMLEFLGHGGGGWLNSY